MKILLMFFLIGMNLFAHVYAAKQEVAVQANSPELKLNLENSQPRCFLASGVVRKVDTDNRIVTIFHDAIADLGWPSMTMPFAVKDSVLLTRFKNGEAVEFEFVIDEKNSVIVGVR